MAQRPWFFLILPLGLLANEAHFLSASMVNWDEGVLERREKRLHTSFFDPLEGMEKLRLRTEALTLPTLSRQGASPAEISSEQFGSQVLYAPNSSVVLGIGRKAERWMQSYANNGSWSVDWESSRVTQPLYLYVHGMHKTMLWDMMGGIIDGERGGYIGAIRFQDREPKRSWTVEWSFSQERIAENFIFGARDSDSSWKKIRAIYHGESKNTDFFLSRTFAFGSLQGKGTYSWCNPRLNQPEEYQLSDSSQTLALSAGWSSLDPKVWHVDWKYAESQSFSFGRRIPDSAKSFKRFHYALGHGYFHFLEVGRGGFISDWVYWNVNTAGHYYLYRNNPHPDSYLERKETLSYNRLESSFITSVYGGFQNSAELVSMQLEVKSVSVTPKLVLSQKSKWKLDISLPATYMNLDFQFLDETITRTLFSTKVERNIVKNIVGPLVLITPRLEGHYYQGPLSLKIQIAKAFPIWEQLKITPKGGGGRTGSGTTYPMLQNTLSFGVEAGLDF